MFCRVNSDIVFMLTDDICWPFSFKSGVENAIL